MNTLPTFSDCCNTCVGQSTVSLTTSFGWYQVSDIASLRAIQASSSNVFASVGTLSGGFFGDFGWNNTSVAADDGVTVINPTGNSGAGRWERLV